MQCSDLDPGALEGSSSAHGVVFKASVRELGENKAAAAYRAMAEDFDLVICLVRELQSHNLKKRHWEAIEDVLGFSISIPSDSGSSGDSASSACLSVTLGTLVERHSIKELPAIRAITSQACHEATLYESLKRVQTTWSTLELEIVSHGIRNEMPILVGLPEYLARVEDDVVLVSRLLQSPYVGYLQDEVEEWRVSLVKLMKQLDYLVKFQSHLAQLAALLRGWDASNVTRASPCDLSSLLPSVERTLSDSESWWRNLVTDFAADSHIMRVVTQGMITRVVTWGVITR